MARTIDQNVGPYRVLGKIGEGGPPPLASGVLRELSRGLAEAHLSGHDADRPNHSARIASSTSWAKAGWARCIARAITRLNRDVAIKVLPAVFDRRP